MTSADPAPAAAAFAVLVRAVHDRLPGVLRRIPVTFVGFAIINLFTFGVDLAFLWLFHGRLRAPYEVSVTMSFALASVVAFLLNKVLNFRAHGQMAKQSSKYALVIVSNYVLWILLFSSLLEALGVHYQLARITGRG